MSYRSATRSDLRCAYIVPQVPPLERIVTEIVELALGAVVMDAGHGQVDTHELVKACQVPSGVARRRLIDGAHEAVAVDRPEMHAELLVPIPRLGPFRLAE